MATADRWVEAVFQVLDYFKPKFFFIENPEGLLATRPAEDVSERDSMRGATTTSGDSTIRAYTYRNSW
jgi:site-specific DNA-cytosine methylase